MVDLLRPLRINAVELLRRPGATLPVVEEIAAEVLGVVHERLNGEIEVVIELESTNDGIVVSGTVGAAWAAPCRRCLKDLSGVARVDIDERYQIEIIDDEAYPIENGQLDLVPMVRELAMIELDAEQVCQAGCKGLCPGCGLDWNTGSCDCDNTVTDHRWSDLDGLVLDE